MAAVGRMRQTTEAEIVTRYLDRAKKSGQAAALTDFKLIELDEARARNSETRKSDEAGRLRAATPEGSRTIVLDERGKALTSRKLAETIADWRDSGAVSVALLIGGPDGHDKQMRTDADLVLSLGTLTMPHILARAVLSEQLYRVTTILTGHPYHRD